MSAAQILEDSAKIVLKTLPESDRRLLEARIDAAFERGRGVGDKTAWVFGVAWIGTIVLGAFLFISVMDTQIGFAETRSHLTGQCEGWCSRADKVGNYDATAKTCTCSLPSAVAVQPVGSAP